MAPTKYDHTFAFAYLSTLNARLQDFEKELEYVYDRRMDLVRTRLERDLIDPRQSHQLSRGYSLLYDQMTWTIDEVQENLNELQHVLKYIFEEQPQDHPATHAYFQDIVRNIDEQDHVIDVLEDTLHHHF